LAEKEEKIKTDANLERTEILYGPDNIVKRTIDDFHKIQERLDSCTDSSGPSVFLNDLLWNEVIELKSRSIRLRFITEITRENVNFSKDLLKVTELRHLDKVKGNFGIIDGRVYGASASAEEGQPPIELIHSTVKTFVDQQQYFFDMLWNKSIPAEVKIKEIEQGIKPEIIEIIQDAKNIKNLYLDLIKSSTFEVMLMIPTANALHCQINIGISQLLKEISSGNICNTDKNVNIRILSSVKTEYNKTEEQKLLNDLISFISTTSSIQIRNIETVSTALSTIIVVDKKESLVVEIKDDSKDDFIDSIGFATYSNSASTVLSFASIFESLWIQTELYQQLTVANEQLKIHDMMQKEFINIAVHELRNPIQPIIGLTEILKSKTTDKKQQELHDIVVKSAKRLMRLSEDVLDITRIENHSLSLHKENFNLNKMIQNTISEFINQISKTKQQQLHHQQHKGTLKIESLFKDDVLIYADRSRLNQVISNLLDNAIKFTNEDKVDGNITVTVEKEGGNYVVVSIKDTGKGIDSEILPRLFTKFVTKSGTGGTGLGLFISKSIVDAHDGKIWAENNKDGNGATFSFSIPLSEP
jgi:two-component system, OmpR family, sensor histidine kinase VicK